MSSVLRSSAAVVLAAASFLAIGSVRPAHALTACTAADITAQDAGCPASGACSITHSFTVGASCVLDFTGRAVTVSASGVLDVGPNRATLNAGSLTVAPGGQIIGQEHCAPPVPAPCAQLNPSWTINSGGPVDVQASGSTVGRISIGTDWLGGTIAITAAGSVTISGAVQSSDTTNNANGGNVTITSSGGDIITNTGSTLAAQGGTNFAGGGFVSLSAAGRVSVAQSVDVSGGQLDAGEVDATTLQQDVVLNGVVGDSSQYGFGAAVFVTAATSVQLLGPMTLRGGSPGGGGGGIVQVTAGFGDVTIGANILADGAATNGVGGSLDFRAAGMVTVNSGVTVSAQGGGNSGTGGTITMEAGRNVSSSGTLNVSGQTGGAGGIGIDARGGVTLGGSVSATGLVNQANGGSISITAGDGGFGPVTISGTVTASAGGCSSGVCGNGKTVKIQGCDVTVTATGQVLARAGGVGGAITLTARELMTVSGPINATKSSSSGTDGSVTLVHRVNKFTGAGTITPTPTHTVLPVCTAPGQTNCLVPCPTCGNGIVEFPETCDGGNAVSCDGCSQFCQIESCSDGNPCTTDVCDAQLGCGGHIPVPNGTSCSDGQVCNGNEVCFLGVCGSGANPPAGTPCSDNNACTVSDQCNGSGTCVPGPAANCDDANACTTDSCDPATGCVHTCNTGATCGSVCGNTLHCTAGGGGSCTCQ
jgi:cysteine-rich repeat protein